MLTVKKVLNTSVLLVNKDGAEAIITAKGIGFGVKKGDTLDETAKFQWYVPLKESNISSALELIQSISQEILEVTATVVEFANQKLNVEFERNLYLMLADHINFAIERHKKNIVITNRLGWEMRNFYPKEFAVAEECLHLINLSLLINLPEEEAVNIAFYLVNAQTGHRPGYDSAYHAQLIGDLVSIIQYSLNQSFDQNSSTYLRFIMHIRFFVERFLSNSMLSSSIDIIPNEVLQNQYMAEVKVIKKLEKYLWKKYDVTIPKEEINYLVIHVNRLLRQQ